MRSRYLPKKSTGNRLERFNIVLAILLAGWVPSLLSLWVSYTILTNTLESKILRDRQSFVQLIGHLIGDDLSRTSGIIDYYQTSPETARILTSGNAPYLAPQWLSAAFYSHPRIDGMFLAGRDGRLIASVPHNPNLVGKEFGPAAWRREADATAGTYVSPVHQRNADKRMATEIIGAVRTPDHAIVGYLGVSVLAERIGRRLSTIQFADQTVCQVLDQDGRALFTKDLIPNSGPILPSEEALLKQISSKRGLFEKDGNLYSFSPIESTGWTVVVIQPKSIVYKPAHDLLQRMALLTVWLLGIIVVFAWLGGMFYRRQMEASQRIEREVIFNEKILANMPIGIAFIDPGSRKFLQANEAFGQMAQRFGGLSGKEITDATYEQVKIAPPDALEKVLSFGTPFQAVEQPLKDPSGMTHFLNVNLLRLQSSHQHIEGVLYLVEDKTRDVALRRELMNANTAKDQFLALLSHELRNPLSPVIAMVGELEATAPKSPEVRQAIEVIRRNVELEARLIDDLLDITRIARGKLQLSFETVSAHEILRRAYEICREEIATKSIQTEFRLAAEHVYIEGDPARLQQVFWNIIKNSVKFTPSGGRITIATHNPTPQEIEIKISDTGIGIGADKINKIFNAFEQGQTSITRRFGGLGLGLAISKAMVEAHAGTIRVASPGKDKGATFTILLKTVAKPAAELEEGDGEKPARSKRKRTASRKGRVLVVDDHADTCIGMQMMLERRGYKITVAHSADQAMEKAEQENFDLLISDIGLPDRSGYDLMRELRESKGLPGIALSGFGMESDITEAREAGFAEHLTKPINFERLEAAIRRLLDAEKR